MADLETLSLATVRGNTVPADKGAALNVGLTANHKGEPLFTLASPNYMEMARQNQLYAAYDSTARAAVVAIPTTTAVSSLWNGEAIGGKCYVIDRITFSTVANTAAASFGVVINLQNLTSTAPTDVKVLTCLGGGTTYPGTARVQNGATAVAADGWLPIGCGNGNLVASGFGTPGDSGPLDGRIIIRPGKLLHTAIVGSATNLTGRITFWWYEVTINNLIG